MKTINDLIEWLDTNGYKEGADDIRRMMTDEKYADECWFGMPANIKDLSEVANESFLWDQSDKGYNYWYEIYERLCIIEEND